MNEKQPLYPVLLALAALFLALSVYLQLGTLLNHDVAWYLLAAGRMLNGGGYEKDFFEINMPQSIATYVPPYLLSRISSVSLPTAARAWVFLLALQSIGLIVWIQRHSPGAGTAWPLWLSWLLIGFLLLPGYDFGQREHLMVILSAPFVFMLAPGNAPRSRMIRAYITALAAWGFYLKPHYALLPFVLLGITAYRQGSWRTLARLELPVLLAVGGGIAAGVVADYPGWFTVARWTLDLYGAYGSLSWNSLLTAHAPLVAACLVGFLSMLADRRFRDQSMPLLVAAIYACLAFLLQMKGWKYQFLPVTLFTFVVAGLAFDRGLSAARRKEVHGAIKLALSGVLAVALASEAVFQANTAKRDWLIEKDPVVRALRGDGHARSVFVFAIEMYPAFPAVVYSKLKWGSRYSTLWPLVKLIRALHDAGNEHNARLLKEYWGPFAATVAEDLGRYKPDRVLVDIRTFAPALPPGNEVVSLFMNNPNFARSWRQYRRVGDVHGYRIYEHIDSGD